MQHSISEVAAFLQLPYGNLNMKSASADTLSRMAIVSRAGLQHAIENHIVSIDNKSLSRCFVVNFYTHSTNTGDLLCHVPCLEAKWRWQWYSFPPYLRVTA